MHGFLQLYKLDSREEFEHQWSQVMAKYDMPLGIFVGINNHEKTILFGCALLRNETTSAFQWLMKVRKLFNYLVRLWNYFLILFD